MLTMRTLPLPSVRLTSLRSPPASLASRSVSPTLMGFPSSCRGEPLKATVFPAPAAALPFETGKSLYVKLLPAHPARKKIVKARVIEEVGFMACLLGTAWTSVVIDPPSSGGQGRGNRGSCPRIAQRSWAFCRRSPADPAVRPALRLGAHAVSPARCNKSKRRRSPDDSGSLLRGPPTGVTR